MSEEFPRFVNKAKEVLGGDSGLDNLEDYRELLCGDCPFYHDDEEENEECGSFRLMKTLLENDAFDLENALDELE